MFIKKNIKKISIFFFILLIILLIIINLFMSKNKVKIENKEIINVNENKELNLIDCFLNIKEIKSAKLKNDIKFIGNDDKELLSCEINSSLNKKNENINLKGAFLFKIKNFDISLLFPLYINNFNNLNQEIFLEIKNEYKEIFNMNESEDYLYISQQDLNKLKEHFDFSSKIKTNDVNERNYSNIINNLKCKSINNNDYIYDINLNNEQFSTIYNYLNNKVDYKSIINVLNLLIKNDENLKQIQSVNGQAYISFVNEKYIVTNFYIEIKSSNNSKIVFQFKLSNINDKNIIIDKFEKQNNKDLLNFIAELSNTTETDKNNEKNEDNKTDKNNASDDIDPYLDEETNESKNDNEKKNIKIGEIFFTGEDESIIKKGENNEIENPTFNLTEIGSKINVFINFSDCTKNTDLNIKWFYNDQVIPLIENKISNGEYEEGILKSSITFNDINNISTGTYTMKIYKQEDEEPIKTACFTIK